MSNIINKYCFIRRYSIYIKHLLLCASKIAEFRFLMGNYPLIIGAGLTTETVQRQLSFADGAIVGSCFKPHGITTEKIQRSLVKEFMDEVKKTKKEITIG